MISFIMKEGICMLKFLKCKVKNVHKSAQAGVSQSDPNAPNKEDADETLNNAAKNRTVNADKNSPQSVSENVSIAAASDESQGATENTSQNAAEDIPNSSSPKAPKDPDQFITKWIVYSVGALVIVLGIIMLGVGAYAIYAQVHVIKKVLDQLAFWKKIFFLELLLAPAFSIAIALICRHINSESKCIKIIIYTCFVMTVASDLIVCFSGEAANYSEALLYMGLGAISAIYGVTALVAAPKIILFSDKEKILKMSSIIISIGALYLALIQLFKK